MHFSKKSFFDHNFECDDFDDSHNVLDCKQEFDLAWS